MQTYRAKPIEIHADRWFPNKEVEGVQVRRIESSNDASLPHGGLCSVVGQRLQYFVVTTHGNEVLLKAGDWVVREPDGKGYYPVKHELFVAKYERTAEEVGP